MAHRAACRLGDPVVGGKVFDRQRLACIEHPPGQ